MDEPRRADSREQRANVPKFEGRRRQLAVRLRLVPRQSSYLLPVRHAPPPATNPMAMAVSSRLVSSAIWDSDRSKQVKAQAVSPAIVLFSTVHCRPGDITWTPNVRSAKKQPVRVAVAR